MVPDRVAGKERSFGLGVLLTVVTLGLYQYWWHHVNYKETETWLGRSPRIHFLVWAIPVVNVVAWAIAQFAILRPAANPFTGEVPFGASMEALFFVWLPAGLLHVTLLSIVVSAQVSSLERISRITNHRVANTTGIFMGSYIGGILLAPVFFVGLVFLLKAYRRLQADYNNAWRSIRAQRLPAPQPAVQRQSPRQRSMAGSAVSTIATVTSPSAQRAVTTRETTCPACNTPVVATGAPGSIARVACGACGKTGRMRLS